MRAIQRPALLDTDTLSAILRGHAGLGSAPQDYLALHRRFTFSIITRYEILRGLNARRASSRIRHFEVLCSWSDVLPITDEIVVQTARIYGDLHRRGELIGDADILIAATAIVHGLVVITNNESHFRRIPELTVENWLH